MAKKFTIRQKTETGYSDMHPKTEIGQVEGFRDSINMVEGSSLFSTVENCANDTDIDIELTIADGVRAVDLKQTAERRFVYLQFRNTSGGAITIEPASSLDGVTVRAVSGSFDIPDGGCLEASYIRRGSVITFLSTQNLEAL
jgi:hypothetical protein